MVGTAMNTERSPDASLAHTASGENVGCTSTVAPTQKAQARTLTMPWM